jgi:hypothetical protein
MNPTLRQALRTVLHGTALGTVILGVGGRIAMRFIALKTTGASGFSLGGTMTVVFLGAVSGAVAGATLALTRATLARWSGVPTLVYWALLLAITLQGLRPLDPVRVAWFLPLVVLLGVLLQVSTRKRTAAG